MNLTAEDLLGAYHKLIMDPVHGGIPLQKHEVAIIDHPLFQRLRFICQNDILSLVFPGATHSRFLHSIGTAHVGGRMFKAMIENRLKYHSRNRVTELSCATLKAIGYFYKLIRCACLLHDCGHCSFSHQFSKIPAVRKLLAEPNRFAKLWNETDVNFAYPTAPDRLEHEHFSIRVAHEILSDILIHNFDLGLSDILSLMETTQITPSEQFVQHACALWPLVAPDITLSISTPPLFASKLQHALSGIISGELDADRADYMLRDGFHSSVTIGGFNLDHLLNNLHLAWCPQTEWFGLAISEKGLGALEDFVYSRYQMYRQVYAHKTAQGFDWLLRSAIEEVMARQDIANFVAQGLGNLKDFKDLTDNYFWEAFRQYAKKHPVCYSQCILDRIKMQHLATRINLSEDDASHYVKFLAKEHNKPLNEIVASSITAKFTKIKKDFSNIKVLLPGQQNHTQILKLIANTSDFFAKFGDDRITHFYINPVSS